MNGWHLGVAKWFFILAVFRAQPAQAFQGPNHELCALGGTAFDFVFGINLGILATADRSRGSCARADNKPKVRRAEDWRHSGVNRTTQVPDSPAYHDTHAFVQVARAIREDRYASGA